MPHSRVNGLLETADGRVWVATGEQEDGGIAVFNKGDVEAVYTIDYGLPHGLVRDVTEVRFGPGNRQVWGATKGGLAVLLIEAIIREGYDSQWLTRWRSVLWARSGFCLLRTTW